MRIDHYKTINRTPALPLALEAWYELAHKDHCTNEIMVSWDHESLVAYGEDNRTPIGVLTYYHTEYNYTFTINLGYVVPIHRGKGVYNELWKVLIGCAQQAGAHIIVSSTSIRNTVMQSVAKAQGRQMRGYHFEFKVPHRTI